MLSFIQYLKESDHTDLNGKPRKVGKRIGGEIYVHKDWTHHAGISHDDLEKAKKHLPKDHQYTIVKHNPKEKTFSFIHSHDFDSAHEPTVGRAVKVHHDGRTTETAQKKDPQIYHHKWEMVGDNHKGFDVAKSKERSKHWRGVVGKDRAVSSRIGTKSYWDREVVPKLSESIDPKKLKKAANHNDAYHILDSHEGTKGGTPAAGGCGVLAHALHKHLPGSKLVDIHNKTTGNTEHVGVHHGDHVYDAYGAHPAKHFVSRFQKREGVHGDLEMTDHHPKRTANSGISTHAGTAAKLHAHLQKHL